MKTLRSKFGFFFMLMMALSFSACSKHHIILTPPNTDFKLTADQSLIFGKIQIINTNGTILLHEFPQWENKFQTVLTFWNIESKQRYSLAVSEIYGYFIAPIPPGRYQLLKVICPKTKVKKGHLIPCSQKCGRYKTPTKIFFETIPSHATYIGTLSIKIAVRSRTRVVEKKRKISGPPRGQSGFVTYRITRTPITHRTFFVKNWSSIDEYERKAKNIFKEMAPNLELPIKKMMTIKH
jgi:hypothetical protein